MSLHLYCFLNIYFLVVKYEKFKKVQINLIAMKQSYKKSEVGLAVILILVIVVFFFGWLINTSQRECKTNRDCGSESYCGSDFSCHTYPNIQKTVVQYNFIGPSLIIGIAIVIAAIIFRWNTIRAKESEEVVEEYKSTSNIKTP